MYVSSPSLRASMAKASFSLTSSSSGCGMVTLEIHILPCTPGSRTLSLCILPTATGLDTKDRNRLTATSVLRSCLLAFGDSQSVLRSAVLRINGVFGRSRRISALGLDVSMLALIDAESKSESLSAQTHAQFCESSFRRESRINESRERRRQQQHTYSSSIQGLFLFLLIIQLAA